MRCVLGAVAFLLMTPITPSRSQSPLERVPVLPLALDDNFEFRKFKIFRNALATPASTPIPTRDLMIDFERRRRLWGAMDGADIHAKTGQYFTFFWRTKRAATLVLRLEYRQANLKNYVQARDLYYPNAKGNYVSEFAILGDDYEIDGPITSWRVVLIEDRKIVALLQSRVWQ